MTLAEQYDFIARWNAEAIERGRADVAEHAERASRALERLRMKTDLSEQTS